VREQRVLKAQQDQRVQQDQQASKDLKALQVQPEKVLV
jgi:hypothetical protein